MNISILDLQTIKLIVSKSFSHEKLLPFPGLGFTWLGYVGRPEVAQSRTEKDQNLFHHVVGTDILE